MRQTPYYLVSYERDVIRPLALGKFEDLLEATAHSPAMLALSRQRQQHGPRFAAAEKEQERRAPQPRRKKKAPEGLNENYARELMELHTLGVNGGYTQADVTQVARILTGWTVDRPQRGGGFKFDENRHEPGTKKVLGKKIKEHGELEGRELLHMLATRPATAQFISRKLAVRFVSETRRRRLVDRMAKSYMSSGGDISVGAQNALPFPGVLGRQRLPCQGQNSHRVHRLRRARQQRAASTTCSRWSTPCATWACRSMAPFLPPATSGLGYLGEHRRAGQPHELCALPGRQQASRRNRKLGPAR